MGKGRSVSDLRKEGKDQRLHKSTTVLRDGNADSSGILRKR